jgi:hypothetical protein
MVPEKFGPMILLLLAAFVSPAAAICFRNKFSGKKHLGLNMLHPGTKNFNCIGNYSPPINVLNNQRAKRSNG